MADQKINELPTKSSPSTGDKVLMIGTAEEYQMLVDDLATAVLDKLTSKSYTLDQGTKTLIAALNELNSKSIKTASNRRYIRITAPFGYNYGPVIIVSTSSMAVVYISESSGITEILKSSNSNLNVVASSGTITDIDTGSEYSHILLIIGGSLTQYATVTFSSSPF